MNTDELIQTISIPDVDVDHFVQQVYSDACIRAEVVRQMLVHPNIMVYYHCYYVVSKASESRPELFYEYWDMIATLLNHENSYHRDFALTIIANLTRVDHENRFAVIAPSYFEHVHDEKFMTGMCCVRNCMKIIQNKPELKDQIICLLLTMDQQSAYTEKQKALMRCDVLEILDQIDDKAGVIQGRDEYIRACVTSISPKTRRKAKALVEKYGLSIN